MDSGASAHMCKDRDAFEEYEEVHHARSILSAKSDVKLNVIGHGTVKLRVWTGHAWIDARLENTLQSSRFVQEPVFAQGCGSARHDSDDYAQ
uniref:Retrovirus-related Pol polyprotein from transposon TNT 1-94-like beta-barrel domain-containing protein n=1 Tax=Peronospora matthiolae TaxID=2874970 RepID=A0AAV1TWX8_9STRA